eukprot:11037723-Heterocapsa_arctica.AAC.1
MPKHARCRSDNASGPRSHPTALRTWYPPQCLAALTSPPLPSDHCAPPPWCARSGTTPGCSSGHGQNTSP